MIYLEYANGKYSLTEIDPPPGNAIPKYVYFPRTPVFPNYWLYAYPMFQKSIQMDEISGAVLIQRNFGKSYYLSVHTRTEFSIMNGNDINL